MQVVHCHYAEQCTVYKELKSIKCQYKKKVMAILIFRESYRHGALLFCNNNGDKLVLPRFEKLYSKTCLLNISTLYLKVRFSASQPTK